MYEMENYGPPAFASFPEIAGDMYEEGSQVVVVVVMMVTVAVTTNMEDSLSFYHETRDEYENSVYLP